MHMPVVWQLPFFLLRPGQSEPLNAHCSTSVSYTHLDVYKRQALKGTLVIPKNITVINDYLFTNCIHLEGVVLPDGVTAVSYTHLICADDCRYAYHKTD